MKRTFAAVLSLALLALPIAVAHADNSALLPYFEKLEGHWTGKGAIDELNGDGGLNHREYTGELQSDRQEDGVWSVLNHVVDLNGVSSQNTVVYTVRGETLLVGISGGMSEPVQITQATPLAITYQVERVDVLTGRRYVLSYAGAIDESGQHLRGQNTISTNGVAVSTETFDLARD